MHNGKYQCHVAVCCTYHRQTYSPAAKQEPYQKEDKKACLLKKNIEELFWEKIVRVGNEQKKGKVETATGLGRGRRRRRREEIVKWNQMTPLRFQTVRRHQTSEKGKGGNSNRTQQRQKKKKRGDSKAESNDIPEIPDCGETSDIRKREKVETATGLGLGRRRRREEIVKWKQMTSVRFQTVGRHQTSPAS